MENLQATFKHKRKNILLHDLETEQAMRCHYYIRPYVPVLIALRSVAKEVVQGINRK